MDNVIISVCAITYNHGPYIAQAIQSVVAQKCNYKFEMVICDDCSKDDTREIIKKYAALYPDIIRPILNEFNLGMQANNRQSLLACKGKYIAILEGDDYWIDPYKLQKQCDFMESHPDYSLCFSGANVINEEGLKFPDQLPTINESTLSIEDIIGSIVSIMPTASLFFRNSLTYPLPAFFEKALSQDIALQLILADKGKIKYFNEVMVVYRHHTGGVTKSDEHVNNAQKKLAELFKEADEYFHYKYSTSIKKRLNLMSKIHLIYGARNKKGIKRILHYFDAMPEYIKYSNGINVKELLYYHIILFFPKLLNNIKK